MTAQTLEEYAASIGAEIVDLDLSWPDTRPIVCRGYKCDCKAFARWRTVAGYVECQCGHTEQAHKQPSTGSKKPKKMRR